MKSIKLCRRPSFLSLVVGLSVALFAAGGCAAEMADSEPEGPERAASDEAIEDSASEDIQSTQQALIACIGSQGHGGDAFPRSFDGVLGCACGAGRERTTFRVWNEGNGSCSALGFASSDPRDCRVRVRINQSGGFANGTCKAQVEAENVVCAHSKCVTGSRLRFACSDPCVAQVCGADPFCCADSWDAQCVSEVSSICGQTCR